MDHTSEQSLNQQWPDVLQKTQTIDDFKLLKLSYLVSNPKIWLLEFSHGKANEMGVDTLDELEKLIHRLSASEGPNVLISFSRKKTRRGTAIFIAGAHVTERQDWSQEQVFKHVRRQRSLMHALRQAPVLHICIPNGMALGWGCEFLITADYKIATPDSCFALPETGLGIIPGANGSSELVALIGLAHTLRLGMTGEKIDAPEALRIGLVQEVSDDLSSALERAYQLADLNRRLSPTATATFKKVVLSCLGEPVETRCEIEAQAYEHCVESGQAKIGRIAFDSIRQGKSVDWGTKKMWT